MTKLTPLTMREEKINSLTHGVGILLSAVGLPWLVIRSALYGTVWHIVSTSIYGATLVILYSASTLYHSIHKPSLKTFFRHFDQAAIFLLIAGTYTPFTLVNLRGHGGWLLFSVIWGIALAGLVAQAFLVKRYPVVITLCYLIMGWLIVLAFKPLLQTVSPLGISLLVAGGLSYTLGVLLFLPKKLRFRHTYWHLFVLGGSICHFFAVLYAVIPTA